MRGKVREAVDLPTRLGKRACGLLLLLARLRNRALPTRVVYVVDRRAIVDQMADAVRWASIDRIARLPALAHAFHALAAFPAEPRSVLGSCGVASRTIGGWRVDPARPAVIVGTVDIVSSRLPFSGYGDGRSRRSMHAGSLGHDAVVVVDEGHLSPAVGELLRASSRLQDCPEFRSMRLSAGSAATGPALRLLSQHRKRAGVRRRLFARKTARFEPIARGGDLVAAIRKAAAAHRTGAVAVFVRSVAHPRRTRPPLPCEPLSSGRDKPIGCVQRRLERGGRHGKRAVTARPVTRAGLERRRGGQSFRVFESQRLCNILITIGNTTR